MKEEVEHYYKRFRNEVMLKDNTYITVQLHDWYMDFAEERALDKWVGEYPYLYITSSGKVQSCTAIITVERSTYQHTGNCFIKHTMWIDVKFTAELGSDAGSWKGGCIGCSYEMNEGETPLDTLRRMEKERTF